MFKSDKEASTLRLEDSSSLHQDTDTVEGDYSPIPKQQDSSALI
jgi:hypothetical protein